MAPGWSRRGGGEEEEEEEEKEEDEAVSKRLRYAVETAGAIWCAPLCSRMASKEVVSTEPITISVMVFVIWCWSIHGLVLHVVLCALKGFLYWFLSNEKCNQLLHALFGNTSATSANAPKDDAWQTYLDKRAAKGSPNPKSNGGKKNQPKVSKAVVAPRTSANARVPWTSLGLVSEVTDGKSTLSQLPMATQNGNGVCFCELADMESTLQLRSENALGILVPAKHDRHVIPQNFPGTGCDMIVIAMQSGVEVLKKCTCFQLGRVTASLGVRTAEVEMSNAQTVEFHASVACEQESLGLHKALSGPKAVDGWFKCISQHFDVQPTEAYGAVIPKDPASIASVKIRIAADKAAALELKSGTGGIIVRRWIPRGAEPPKTQVVWLKGVQASSCAQALACASRFEGFLGLVRKDNKYGAKFAPEHIKEARQALDPGRFAPENVSLVPTSAWIVDGLPAGTDREQVRSLLAAWKWNVIPSQPSRQSWIVLSDTPPPASRCYASCGPLLIRSQLASSVSSPAMTSTASMAAISPHAASTSVPPVVPSPIPLALKEEVSKAVAQSRSHAGEEVGQLRAEVAELKAKLGTDLHAMDAKWTSAHETVTKKVDDTASQLQDLCTDLSKIDIHSAVSQALASALPSALSAALPSVLSDSSTVPSPLRKDRKL